MDPPAVPSRLRYGLAFRIRRGWDRRLRLRRVSVDETTSVGERPFTKGSMRMTCTGSQRITPSGSLLLVW